MANTLPVIEELAGSDDEIKKLEAQLVDEGPEPGPEPEPEPDPEPEPEPEPETPPQSEPETPDTSEPEPDPEPDPEPRGTVPIDALHESRQALKESRTELAETREKMERMETLFADMQKQRVSTGEGEDGEPEIPEYDDDPEGYFRGTINKQQQQIDQLAGDYDQRQAMTQEQELLGRYATAVGEFKKTQADFDEAYVFLGDELDKDLEARGYTDPAKRKDVIEYEEGMLVGRAMSAGINPAEQVYKYALSRGYQPKDAGPDGDDGTKIETLKKGAKAAASLSKTKGTAEASLTLEALADMDESNPDFDAKWEQARKQGLL